MNLNDEKNIRGELVEANHPWMSAQQWNRLEKVRRHCTSHFQLIHHHPEPDPTPLLNLVIPRTRLNDPLTNNLLEDVIHRQTQEIIRDLHHHIIYEVPLPPDEGLLYTRKTRIRRIQVLNHTAEELEDQVLVHIPKSDGRVDKKRYDINLPFHTVHRTHRQCQTNIAEDEAIMIHIKDISITPTAADYPSKNRENKSVI